jgi:hypothetical protein
LLLRGEKYFHFQEGWLKNRLTSSIERKCRFLVSYLSFSIKICKTIFLFRKRHPELEVVSAGANKLHLEIPGLPFTGHQDDDGVEWKVCGALSFALVTQGWGRGALPDDRKQRRKGRGRAKKEEKTGLS